MRAPQPPARGFTPSQPTDLGWSVSLRALRLPVQHQGRRAGRPAVLSAFICRAKTTVISICLSCQFVKLNKDRQWLGEFRVVVHTVRPTGSCADWCWPRLHCDSTVRSWQPHLSLHSTVHGALGHARILDQATWVTMDGTQVSLTRGPMWAAEAGFRRLQQPVAVMGHPEPCPNRGWGSMLARLPVTVVCPSLKWTLAPMGGLHSALTVQAVTVWEEGGESGNNLTPDMKTD